MSASKVPDGCSLILYAYGIFMVGYLIFWFASGGNPEVKQLRDDCYRRETRQYVPGTVPDFAIEDAVAKCERELRVKRGLKP